MGVLYVLGTYGENGCEGVGRGRTGQRKNKKGRSPFGDRPCSALRLVVKVWLSPSKPGHMVRGCQGGTLCLDTSWGRLGDGNGLPSRRFAWPIA
jgi:hypothetical protein